MLPNRTVSPRLRRKAAAHLLRRHGGGLPVVRRVVVSVAEAALLVVRDVVVDLPVTVRGELRVVVVIRGHAARDADLERRQLVEWDFCCSLLVLLSALVHDDDSRR